MSASDRMLSDGLFERNEGPRLPIRYWVLTLTSTSVSRLVVAVVSELHTTVAGGDELPSGAQPSSCMLQSVRNPDLPETVDARRESCAGMVEPFIPVTPGRPEQSLYL